MLCARPLRVNPNRNPSYQRSTFLAPTLRGNHHRFEQDKWSTTLQLQRHHSLCISGEVDQRRASLFQEYKPLIWLGAAFSGLLGLLLFQSADAEEEVEDPDKLWESDIPNSLANCDLPIEEAVLTFAPQVPPPITRKHEVLLKVNMYSSVKEMQIDSVYTYEMWPFNDHVPGPFVRARVGDVLDVSLTNKDQSGMQHNIDWHCVHGPGGGAPLLTSDQNETRRARFKLLAPGLYIYHCSVAPVGMHVANGMYGLMLVEPKEGLSKVDKEFFIVQSEIYAEATPRDPTSKKLDMSYDNGLNERPDYVVFNGKVDAHTSQGAPLQVNTGDKVRIFFGNAGPNLVSSFHIIGGLFDKVYREGDLVSPPARYLQTTLVPSGGATMVELDVLVPGTYTLVDHSLFRLEKGAVGFLQAKGAPRPDIFHSEHEPKVCKDCKIHP